MTEVGREDKKEAQEQWTLAEEAFAAGDFHVARQAASRVMDLFPGSKLAARASERVRDLSRDPVPYYVAGGVFVLYLLAFATSL